MPDELSPAHKIRSGIAPLGRNYARTEAVRTNQIVRAGSTTRNQPRHQRALGLNLFSTNMAAAGELGCADSCERGAWKQRDIPGPAWGARGGEAQLAEANGS